MSHELIIIQIFMQQSIVEKQREKIDKLQQQLKETKKEVVSLKNKLSTSERKRKLMGEKESDKKKEITQRYLYCLLNDINTLNL